MTGPVASESKVHDLLSVVLGGLAAGVLISSPWQVDTSGPYPFYKGALIFPLLVLSLMVLASLPAVCRLLSPPAGASWRLDGAGAPSRPLMILGCLVAYLIGLRLVGLEISALLFLAGSLYLLGHRSVLTLVGVPLIVTGVVAVIFKYLLQVYFPAPLLFDWLWG